jgi:hypothetical protein
LPVKIADIGWATPAVADVFSVNFLLCTDDAPAVCFS